MKVKGLFILLILCSWSLNLNAQEKPVFPITGTFKLQTEKGKERDFNKVIITKTGYSVLMNDRVVRSYKILSKSSEGFQVEQYFEGDQKRDKANFVVRLDKENADDCYISVMYGSYVEKIHLVKIN